MNNHPVAKPNIIKTPRLYARPVGRKDYQTLLDLFIAANLTDVGNIATVAKNQIEQSLKQQDQSPLHAYLLYGVDDDHLKGHMGLRVKSFDGQLENELQYILLPDARGSGLITEALGTLIDKAFTTSPIISLIALVDPLNKPSLQVVHRLGLSYEKHIIIASGDSLLYRLTRKNWLKLRQDRRITYVPRFMLKQITTPGMAAEITMARTAKDSAPGFIKYLQNKKISQMTLAIPYPYRNQDADEFIASLEGNDDMINWSLFHGDTVIGCVGLTWRMHLNNYELGFWLAEPFWGLGIMPAAVRAVADYTLYGKRLATIYSCCFSYNPQSRRVHEKCGFITLGLKEGYRRIKDDKSISCYVFEKPRHGTAPGTLSDYPCY